MGTGLGWTDEERVALCKAYLSTSLDPVKGADQSGPTFWASVVAAWKGLLAGRPGVRRRTERGVGGVQKQWDKIRKGVNEFGSHYMAVKRMELTGNPSDEDMISAAMARFCGTSVCKAMRKDRAADEAKGKTTKRKFKSSTESMCTAHGFRAGGRYGTLTSLVGPPGPLPMAAPPVQDQPAALPAAAALRATLTTKARTWGPEATSRARAAQRRPKVTRQKTFARRFC